MLGRTSTKLSALLSGSLPLWCSWGIAERPALWKAAAGRLVLWKVAAGVQLGYSLALCSLEGCRWGAAGVQLSGDNADVGELGGLLGLVGTLPSSSFVLHLLPWPFCKLKGSPWKWRAKPILLGIVVAYEFLFLQELLGHRRSFSSTRKFSRNSWATDSHFRLLGCSRGTPGPQTVTNGHSRLLGCSLGTPRPRTELLGHGRSFSSTGMFSMISWVTDGHSRLLRGSLGTPGSRMVIFVYWEVLEKLLGHERSFSSTGRFSRNSWATDGHSRLLGSSPGTPGTQTELLGHGRSFSFTRMFSRNSWATDGHSLLRGCSPGTPGLRTVIFVYWWFSRNSWAMNDHSRLLGSSPGTPRPWTTNLVYWEVLQEVLGHRQPFTPTGRSTDEQRLEARSPIQPPSNAFCRYLSLSTIKATERSKPEDHQMIKIAGDRAAQVERRQTENLV
ncbi:hypothetical protein V8G54_017550 [Vigna mungo]|uniref:Uncharacterized protein n=1 Tax=Vigna mungo TaxID=3915 RepID=A0AAQ3NM56_VIGMU